MPFKSSAQRRLMYAKHPKIAARWTAEYDQKNLPEKVGKGRKTEHRASMKALIKD